MKKIAIMLINLMYAIIISYFNCVNVYADSMVLSNVETEVAEANSNVGSLLNWIQQFDLLDMSQEIIVSLTVAFICFICAIIYNKVSGKVHRHDDSPLIPTEPENDTETSDEENCVIIGDTSVKAVHPTGFFGRDILVDDILHKLTTEKHVCVHGTGGIGKTQVCEEVASRFDGSILKVYLSGCFSFYEFLNRIEKCFGISEEENIHKKQTRILDVLSKQTASILIYFDNFEDIISEKGEKKEVMFFLSKVRQFAHIYILISSRIIMVGWPVNRLVEPLKDEDIKNLFEKVYRNNGGLESNLLNQKDILNSLVCELEGHPLSAVLVASQACVMNSITEIYNEWKTTSDSVSLFPADANECHISLERALRTSYNSMKDSSEACLIWALLSLMPDELPKEIIEHFSSQNDTVKGIKKLKMLSLIFESRNGEIRMLKPIKRQIFKYDIDLERNTLKRIIEYYNSLLENWFADKKNRDIAKKLVDEILFVLHYVIFYHYEEEAIPLLYQGAHFRNLICNDRCQEVN